MKLNDIAIAYQLQKKFLRGKEITAYKVGASNHRSANFFRRDDVIVGGLEASSIHYGVISKDYPIAEVEIVSKVRLLEVDSAIRFEVIDNYLGIECPEQLVDNPNGSDFVCVADNCAAGDLIIFDITVPATISKVELLINDKLSVVGSANELKYSNFEIIQRSLAIIKKHELPLASDVVLIATGGLTDVFSLEQDDQVEFKYD